MNYILYGSLTSPFVRRLRILLENTPYTFKEVNIFDAQEAAVFNKINPLNQVPALLDGEQLVLDSRQIFDYLNEKHHFQTLNTDQQNLLTIIEGAMDSGVSLLLMKRSSIDIHEPKMFIQRQHDRIESALNYLKPYMTSQALPQWDFLAMTLYSFLDWAQFRNIVDLSHRPECLEFLKVHADRTIVQ